MIAVDNGDVHDPGNPPATRMQRVGNYIRPILIGASIACTIVAALLVYVRATLAGMSFTRIAPSFRTRIIDNVEWIGPWLGGVYILTAVGLIVFRPRRPKRSG